MIDIKDVIIYLLVGALIGSAIADIQRRGYSDYETYIILVIVVALIGMHLG